MRGALFLDRDGTLMENVPYLGDPNKVEVRFDAVQWVSLAKKKGLHTIVVTNQSGVARGLISEPDVKAVNLMLEVLFCGLGADLDAFYYCPHSPDAWCFCRKPNPGMILQAAKEHNIDLSKSAMIGDSYTDHLAGTNAWVGTTFHTTHHEKIIEWLRGCPEHSEPLNSGS